MMNIHQDLLQEFHLMEVQNRTVLIYMGFNDLNKF